MATDRTDVVLIFGPTGVGKTALLERIFTGRAEVVSADALQVYRGQDIGTAKPDAGLLARLPHHLIDILDFSESFSVADFRRMADAAVDDIAGRGRLPVISGGTAFYLKAWLTGLPETPASDPEVRRRLEGKWSGRSDEALRAALAAVDPESAERIGASDRYRMLRALEVHAQTGNPLSSFDVPKALRDDFRVLPIGLNRDRAELYERIDRRVEQMLAAGLEAEVDALRAAGATKDSPGMKGIGYREWFGTEEEPRPSRERVAELIARNSRRYAKRQITFFSSLPGVRWFDASADPDEAGGLTSCVDRFLSGGELPPVT